MQVIDLGGSLREVWQEISPHTFVVTLLRTTGENHWEVRARTLFHLEGESKLVYENMGRNGLDDEKAPQGDSADEGSIPSRSTTLPTLDEIQRWVMETYERRGTDDGIVTG